MKGPLDGVRVLEWAVFEQGPAAGLLLGDLGADVIKIEQPGKGDPGRGVTRVPGVDAPELPGDRRVYFELLNRNKRCIALDLKAQRAREVISRLVRNSDVFIHNHLPSTALRLGMDYDTLLSYNPRLVYANASGYGRRGPARDTSAFDSAVQARSGMMSTVGEPGMPPLGGPWGSSIKPGAPCLR